MKTILTYLALSFCVVASFGQLKTDNRPAQNNYLLKSKRQARVATFLMAGGAALIVTGLVIPRGEVTSVDMYYGDKTYKNDKTKDAVKLAGLILATPGVVFSFLSAKNKRRASSTSLSLKNEKILFPRQNTFILRTQPAITLKVGF